MNNKFPAWMILGGLMLTFAHPGATEEYLGGDAVRALVVGKTMHAKHLKKGFDFKVYFDQDGSTAYRHQGGETTRTTYQFDGNKHCIHWRGKNRCAKIRNNGDGSYTRVNAKGKHIVKWNKVVDGKDI